MNQTDAQQNARSSARLVALISLFAAILALVIPGAAVAKKCDSPPCHSGDGDNDNAGGDYEVALTTGVFQFDFANAALNRKGNLVGTQGIEISRPPCPDSATTCGSTLGQIAWDAVMNTCGGLFSDGVSTPIEAIYVGADDWSVYKNSETMIGINLQTIYLPSNLAEPIEKEIQIILRYYSPGDVFLPEAPGDSNKTSFPLDEYVIWGKPRGGRHSGWDTCFHSDTDERPPLPGNDWIFQLEIQKPN
jgi:hypothetical protein